MEFDDLFNEDDILAGMFRGRPMYYILDEHRNPIPARLLEWASWFEQTDESRIVAQDRVGDVIVSTVFLGLDHNYMPGGPPLLFETMILGLAESGLRPGEWSYCDDRWQIRCATWAEAEANHAEALAMAKCVEG